MAQLAAHFLAKEEVVGSTPTDHTMKTCTKCHVEKSVDDFWYRDKSTGKLNSQCKDCLGEYHKVYSSTRKRPYAPTQQRARVEIRRQWLWDYLLQHPCVDCGADNPVYLEFDHVDPSTKSKTVSRLVLGNAPMDRVDAEISKCVVRCSNCHAIRTAEQFGWYKMQRAQ